YSKGQKDAAAHLINYIYLGNDADFVAFQKAISVPKGDHAARVTLSSDNYNYEIAKKGLLQGGNHPADIDDIIWLFDRFQHFEMFGQAIKIWADADVMVNKLDRLGEQAHQKIA